MAPPRCARCPLPAALRRPRTAAPLCRRCFLAAFEAEAARAIAADAADAADPPFPALSKAGGPPPGSSVAVAASGGKDSAVLAHLLAQLNQRRGWGYRLVLVAVDEGIAGYREAALGALRRGRGDLPLLVLSHRELFGWSVDQLGAKLGKRGGSRCTFCGVWRRQALERGARLLGVDWLATGHNADDIAETVLMNFLRGDVARLRRAATEATGVATEATEATGATGTAAEATAAPGEAPKATVSPRKVSKRPATTKNLAGATKNPVGATKNSMGTTKNPVGTTKNPVETTAKVPAASVATANPMEATESSRGTSEHLMEATAKVLAGSVATLDPTEATTKPMETTENPTEATKSSTGTTRNPSGTTPNSVGTTMKVPAASAAAANPTETAAKASVATTTPAVATPTSAKLPSAAVNPSEPTDGISPAVSERPVAARFPEVPREVSRVPVATPWPAVARCKPLRHAYEKEIVLYAHFKGLDYFSTECVYAPHAYRGHARNLLKDLEATRASTVAALGHSGRRLAVAAEVATKTLGACRRCGFAASQPLCKACVLLASLEKGLPRLGLGKRSVELATGPGGYWDFEGGGRGEGGHEDGGPGACCRGGGGHGAGGHEDGGHGAGGERGGGPGACCRGGGGPGACCGGAGGHGARGPGGEGHHPGGHGACCGGAGGPGAGGPGVGGAEVEVVGGAGGEGRRRVRGLGQVRGALNIWDF